MTIQYMPLSDKDYSDRRFDVILLVEGNIPYPYRDILGYPTIGIGFKIQDNLYYILTGMQFNGPGTNPVAEAGYIADIQAVINKYGSTVTKAQMTQYKNELDAIMANRAAAYGIIRTEFKYLTDSEARKTYNLVVEADYEDRLSKWLGETTSQTMYTIIPKSFERLALLSLTYNGYIGYDYQNNRPIGSPSLRKALLVDGNRAEAWYEIRYNTPSSAERLAKSKIPYTTPANREIFADMFNKIKRNFFEAELFGLYDNPASVDIVEARQVYRMFQNHREDIAKQEALFGVSFDGTPGSYIFPPSGKTPLQAANSDYDATTFFNDGAIDNIEISLNPAKTAILNYINGREDLPLLLREKLIENKVASTNIYLNPHKSTDTNQFYVLDSLLYETGKYANGANDLMLGMDQEDIMYGRKGNDILIGEYGTDSLFGEEGNDVLYGGDGDDFLFGGLDNDTMYGGEGNDVFWGGEGDDVMYGGLGNDTYFINEGDGNDTIEDKDGDNTVILSDKMLNFFYKTEDGNTYISPDGWFTLEKSTGKLTDTEHNIIVTLNENFEEGDFGIDLIDLPADIPALPDLAISNTILGDLAPVDMDPEQEGVQYGYDQWGNVIVDPGQPESGRSDVLYDTTDSDKIEGGGGSDSITVSRGSSTGDWVLGGGGNDYITINAGTNILVEGGSGNDDIYTSAANLNARIYGDSGDDVITTDSNGSGWLYGGEGSDIIDAELLDNSIIEGGAGSDIIIGGINGNNQLFGDSRGEDGDLATIMATHIADGETALDSGVRGDIIAADGENNNFLFGLLRLPSSHFSLLHGTEATVAIQ